MTHETTNPYPVEALGPDDDNGTMPENVEELRQAVVGHHIVSAEAGSMHGRNCYGNTWEYRGLVLTLDNGRRVLLADSDDCCAYTSLETFLLHPDKVDHVIAGVGTTDGFERWHIFADVGDILELNVGWSPGNPFYYGYGFDIIVQDEENSGDL